MASSNNRSNYSRGSSSYSKGERGERGERYIPRERGDDRRERGDDPRPRDAYYEAFEGKYGGDVARDMYGESKVPITRPSICIPRTFPTIRGEQTKRAVFNTFKDLRIGHIDRIDTVHKTDKHGERFCTVYVHLTWNTRDNLARETRQKLIDGQEIKIVYDEPWFWKCTASTIEKPENRYSDTPQHRNSSRPRIDLGDGNRALSYYTREHDEHDHRREQHEEHNQEQLCNMDPEDDEE
jgi:hypothetical protein